MSPVRVRFAPSPTGQLHFGGLRTALYNFLFAKRNGGKIFLRIEDTDRDRTVPGAIEQIRSGLDWAQIKFEKNVTIQSERAEIYRNYLEKLFEKKNHQDQNHVYRCFCTNERLLLLRHECKRQNRPYRYDGRCKNLSEKTKKEFAQQGLPHVVRFNLPTDEKGLKIYDDLIYGEHKHNPFTNEGDFIVMKSDGFPTYHFANVVDDHLMEISHVLRGHEWQTSTSKHLLLYEAFGWTTPKFGHLPLLERERGRKLSKRDPENVRNPIEIEFYREKNFFPDAILNFIAICGGGGFSNSEQLVGKTLDEMISMFDLKLFSRHAAIVDFKKLELCQRAHLKRAFSSSIESRKKIFQQIRQISIKFEKNFKIKPIEELTDDYLQRVMKIVDFRISSIDELFLNESFRFLWTNEELKIEKIENFHQFRFVVERTLKNQQKIRFNFDEARNFVENDETKNLDVKKVFAIWRAVLCGPFHGPPLHEIADFLGPDIVRKRFQRAIELLDENPEEKRK